MLQNLYPYILTIHIVSIIAWMAGLLYLPRLFLYHCRVETDSRCYQLFLTMEEKLLRIIMLPSLLTSWASGLTLVYTIHTLTPIASAGWLHAKLMLVLLLSAYHGVLKIFHKSFKQKNNEKSEKFFRIINEVPTIAMILIVFFVIVKPF